MRRVFICLLTLLLFAGQRINGNQYLQAAGVLLAFSPLALEATPETEFFATPQGGLLGGGSQVYVPKVNPNWLVHP